MLNILGKGKYPILLVSIVLFAAILRFVGLNPGYHRFHPDENTIYSTAVDFVKTNNFTPLHYEYPSLPNYINYLFFKGVFIPLGWVKYFVLNAGEFLDGNIKFPLGKDVYNRILQLEILGGQDVNALIWSRYITAFFGVLVVWAAYLVAKKLYGRKTAIISALLVCVNYRQVLNSHLGLPDIYNSFFFLVSFWLVLLLREKINLRRVILCGVVIGLYLSTKYQIYPLIPLFLIYLENAASKKTLKKKFLSLFDSHFVVIPIISLLVFMLLNPYLFLNLDVAIKQISYASLKYGAGAMRLIVYPYWYLFNIGIGKISSLMVLAGMLLGLARSGWKSVLLLAVIIPFFVFFTYVTNGGFYTRNFVSIIPFLLIFAAYLISQLIEIIPGKVFVIIPLVVLSVTVWENLANSLVILREYTKPWNRELVESWIVKNIPQGSIIAAHSSVPFPDNYTRIVYDRWPWPYYSMADFQEAKADYAIANLDWTDSDYYGWMHSSTWGKPVAGMKKAYSALALWELTDFGIYSETNPWQAPDSNFIVAKVPKYTLISREIVKTFSFKKDQSLISWQSEPVEIDNWRGFGIEYRIKMDSPKENYKDGAVFIKFYSDLNNALTDKSRLAVRLATRDDKPGAWVDKKLIGKVPTDTKYVTLGFLAEDVSSTLYYLDELKLSKADVLEDLNGLKVNKIILDENIIFPNSHGNL